MTNMTARRLIGVLQHLRATTLRDARHASDGDLVSQFVEHNDNEAFAGLVERHSAMVWGVCRRVIGNHHDAEDAFQATFLVLARKAACVRPRDLVANWLHGVARRTALKARTMTAKRRMREQQMDNMPDSAAAAQTSWADLEALIDQEVAALPEKYRIAILLCDLEGKTGRVAARQLKVPEGTLAGRLRTARVMLARRLARHGLVLSGGALAMAISQNAASACAPPTAVSMTLKTATLFAAGKSAAGKSAAGGMISAQVTALTEGVLKSMYLTKLKSAMVAFLVVAGLGGTAGLTWQMQPSAQAAAEAMQTSTAQAEDRANANLRKAEKDFEIAIKRLEQARTELERARAALAQFKGAPQHTEPLHLTTNFAISAASEQIARDFGDKAEAERKRLAISWFGTELPRWEEACKVFVNLARGKKARGYCIFSFAEKRPFTPDQEMWLEAETARDLLPDVLPQQIMHTLLATEFGVGCPLWIREGAGLIAQSEAARNQRLAALSRALASRPRADADLKTEGKAMPLGRCFAMRDYPTDAETWRAQCLSLSQFLLDRRDRAALMAFVKRGMERGWDDAVRRYYGFEDVTALEAAWRKSVQDTRFNAEPPAASNTQGPWAAKLFKETSKDFGACSGDEPLTYRFEMTNIYTVPLEVTNVRASAGCVTWTLSTKTLKPKESGYLEVRMDPRRFTGARTFMIYVSVGPTYSSTVNLTLSANHDPTKGIH
jgi:RNA polymerase sigma factor (sigma-70 family)